MTYAIRLPDGSLVQNIPDEVTPEEAKRQLLARMPELGSKERTWGEAATDIGAALVSGAGGLAQFPGQVVGLLPGMRGLGETLAAPGEKISEFGKSLKSEGLKTREALRSKALSDAEKEGMLAEFATAIKSTITDPALLSTFLTEQIPQLLGPGAAAKITTMLGKGAVEAATAGAAREAAAKALGARATSAAVGTGAVMQGADIGEETYKEAYKLARAQGASEEEAQSVALAKARVAALEAGALSVGAQRLPGGRAIERRLAGMPGEGRIRGALGEALSEAIEEGGGAFAKNIGLQEIDPTRSLTAGIGTAAGLGALGGAGLGAVTGAHPRAEAAPPGPAAELPIEEARRLAAEKAAAEREAKLPPQGELFPEAEKPAGPELDLFGNPVVPIEETQEKELSIAAQRRLRKEAEEAGQERLPLRRGKGPIQTQLEEEVPEPTVRGEAPTTGLSETDILGLGITKKQPILKRMLGKDMSVPEQRDAVLADIENYLNRGHGSEESREKLTAFKEQYTPAPAAPVVETTAPIAETVTVPEAPSVPTAPIVEQPSGAGAAVAGEPSTGAPTGGVGVTEPTGVVPPVTDVGQPTAGETTKPSAIEAPVVEAASTPVYTEAQIDDALAANLITEEQAQQAREELQAGEAPQAVKTTGAEEQVNQIKARMDALRQKNGRIPALKSKRRAEYDALKAQLEALVPPERGALEDRLEEAGATGVFAPTGTYGGAAPARAIVDLDALRTALKGRDPKMYQAVLTYIGIDEDGNYLPKVYSREEAAESVGLKRSSGANISRIADTLGVTQDVRSRFHAAQTDIIVTGKNVSEAGTGLTDVQPRGGSLYEPPKGKQEARYQRFLAPAVTNEGKLDFSKLSIDQLANISARASKFDLDNAGNLAVIQPLYAEIEARRQTDRRAVDSAITRATGKVIEEETVAQEAEGAEEAPVEFPETEAEDATRRLSDEDVAELGARPTPGTTSPAITQAATSGDTTRTLQAVTQTPEATPLDHAVAQRFLGLGRFLGMPKIEIVPQDQVKGSGQYDSETDTVRIAEGQVDTHTVLHETTHGFVHKLIVANERGIRSDEGYRDLKGLYDYLQKNHPELKGEYGMGSVTEFSSEAMSNPQFQKKLAKIPYKARSAWSTFVESVRKLLKLMPGTSSALTEAIASVDSLLRVGREYQTKGPSIKAGAPSLTPAQVQAQPIGAKEDTGFSGFLERKFGSQKVIGLRAKVADSLAAVDAFFFDKYGGRIKDNQGNANPIVLLSRALDSMRFSKVAQETGTLKRDPEGLIVADKLIAGKEFNLIAGQEVSYLKALQELGRTGLSKEEVGKVLVGHREHGLRELVRAKRSDYVQTLTDAQIDAYERRFQSDQRIQRISQMLDAVRFSMIDLMEQTGRIDAAKAAGWKEATGYIPFSRLDKMDNFYEPASPGKRGLGTYRNMRELSGDPTRQLENPLDTFSGLIDWMTRESMVNDASSRALQEMSLFNAAEQIPSREVKSKNQQGAIVETYVNGNKTLFYVPDPALLGAFSYTPPTIPGAIKAMQRGSRVLRAGVTSMPPFVVKQVFDDITRMYAFGGLQNNVAAVRRVLTDFPRIWWAEAFGKKHKIVADAEARGLAGTFDFTEHGNVKNIMAEAGLEKRSIGSRMLHIMEAGAKASDLAVRNAIYEQVYKETGSHAEAENRAREIINFSRRGNARTMDYLIRTVPFFNAFARGTDKLLVAAAGGKLGVGQSIGQPRAVFWKRMGSLAAMATVYALLMSDDDEYNKLPDRVRDRNIIIPFNKEFVEKYGVAPAIPLPADLAFIFKAIPERVIQYYRLQGTPEERSMLEVTRELMKQGYDIFSTPNITPQVLRPLLENMINYSFFLDRPLESQAQQNLRPFERYGMGTSDVAKVIAAKGEDIATSTGVEAFAISPIKLENFIRGMLGTIGGTVLAVGDAMINPTRTDRPLQSQLLPQLTGASTLMKDAIGSRFLDEIYRLDREAEQVHNTYKRLSETDPDRAERFVLENYGLYVMRDSIKGIMGDIRNATTTATAVDKMPDLSPEDRRDMINMLRRDQGLLARQAYELRKLVNTTQAQVDKQLR